MDSEQMQLQAGSVFRMWLKGAHVNEGGLGRKRDGGVRAEVWAFWAQNSADCFLVVGLDAAPHPYSMLKLDLASIAGRECRLQWYAVDKQAPDPLGARAGANADAPGLFPPFRRAT